MEEWRDVVGYEGYYEVSSLGRVRSLDRLCGDNHVHKGRILRPNRLKQGYEQVALSVNGKRKEWKVHRLVAIAFIPLVEGKTDVNHKNGVKHDNRVDNLEWCNDSENLLHAYRVLKVPHGSVPKWTPALHHRKLTPDQIRAIRKDPRTRTAIAKDYGVIQQTVSNIKLGYFYKEIV